MAEYGVKVAVLPLTEMLPVNPLSPVNVDVVIVEASICLSKVTVMDVPIVTSTASFKGYVKMTSGGAVEDSEMVVNSNS